VATAYPVLTGGFFRGGKKAAKSKFDFYLIGGRIYLPPPLLSKRAKEIKARLLDLDPESDEYIALEKELQRRLTNRRWILRPELESTPKLIICDEVSMVNEKLATDLLSFGVRVLVVGDPAQLPPVRGDGYFMSADPNVMLTEIHRQAWDSPVLRMATQVRMNGASSLPFDGMFHFPIRAVGRDDLRAMATVADQVLVGRHVTRRVYNEAMRRAARFSGPMPMVGEKLVCCRNNHDLGVLNGTLWQVLECVEDVKGADLVYRARLASLNNDNVEPIDNVIMDAQAFEADDPNRVFEESDVNHFVPGYAITVHKAQGSQWRDILARGAPDVRHRVRDRDQPRPHRRRARSPQGDTSASPAFHQHDARAFPLGSRCRARQGRSDSWRQIPTEAQKRRLPCMDGGRCRKIRGAMADRHQRASVAWRAALYRLAPQ
jgi:ATP-dependent exoDNAse (exonuclease V) alpha subunit